MRVLILANGEPPSRSLAQRLAAEHDLLIATDGAVHQAERLGLTPQIVTGDFDSIQMHSARAQFPNAEFVATPSQDSNDLQKALDLAADRGADFVTIIGASGGRIDHALANYALLLRPTRIPSITIADNLARVCSICAPDDTPRERRFTAAIGDTVSLISFDGLAFISTEGLRWPLNDSQIGIGTLGVSNEATAPEVTVRARCGSVIVCHLPAKRAMP